MTSKMHTAGDNLRDPGLDIKSSARSVAESGSGTVSDDYWLQLARDAWTESEDYFDANVRDQINKNLAHFNNAHAQGSKYYSDQYKFRARGFRPKTRSSVRKNEAAMALSMFSTSDVVDIKPHDESNEAHVVSSEINKELLEYRLTNTIPWFLVSIGAYQDTQTVGICISHQTWDYKEIVHLDPILDPETNDYVLTEEGEPAVEERVEVVKDTPVVEIRPVENVRFSVAADWTDPINTSPYLIDQISMTIDDVKARSRQTNKTSIPWMELTDEQLMAGVTTEYDPVRRARESNREDSKDERYISAGFNTVWVHRNIMRYEGQDWVYYTLGIYYRLSDPVPLTQEYPWLRPGQRPYIMGFSNIETHKNYPEGTVGLTSTLQQEANDISNQRRDNVSLVLNRRYITRRGANIDFKSLMRNVPGGITQTDDPNTDIRIEAPPEVTRSSYEEQDRVNLDFDDLSGDFNAGSVQSNRKTNETVGGMELLSESSNVITEYQLRIFTETWTEKVIKQVVQLEQYFETDEAILQMVGNKLEMWQRYGVSQIDNRFLQGSMSVTVNVGFGATHPTQRINKLATGLSTVLNFVPEMQGRLDGEQVAKEILGVLGYKGADRFFPPMSPEEEEAAAQQQQPEDPRMMVEQFKAQAAMQLEEARAASEKARLDGETKLRELDLMARSQSEERERDLKLILAKIGIQSDMMELAGRKEITLEQIKAKLGELTIKEQSATDRFLAERDFAETVGGGRGL